MYLLVDDNMDIFLKGNFSTTAMANCKTSVILVAIGIICSHSQQVDGVEWTMTIPSPMSDNSSSSSSLPSSSSKEMTPAVDDGDPRTYFPTMHKQEESSLYLDWFHHETWLSTSSGSNTNGTATTISTTPEQFYPHSIFLATRDNPDKGIALHWRVDYDNKNQQQGIIHMAIAAQARGWVSLGIAEAGGMPGADMVVYERESNILTDRFATDYTVPLLDEHSKDWILEHVVYNYNNNDDDDEKESSFLVVQMRRKLDTGDTLQDRPIVFDGDLVVPPHRIIAAWGDSSTLEYHGPHKRASGSVRFHESDSVTAGRDTENFQRSVRQESAGYVDVTMQNFSIPSSRSTIYASKCLHLSDLLESHPEFLSSSRQEYNIIGFEPLIQSAFPHHMVLYGSKSQDAEDGDCSSMLNQVSLHGWAIGEGPALLPSNVGIPIGPSLNNDVDGFTSFKLSMHFDNRGLLSGGFDDSGIRIYYSSKPKEHTLSLLLLGDPLISLMDQPVVSNDSVFGLSRHVFECPSSCTQETISSMAKLDDVFGTSATALRIQPTIQQNSYMVAHNITVVTELLHMHETGTRMVNRVLREGVVVHEGAIDYWDNQMSGLYPVQTNTFTIQAGDILETECYYNTSKSTGTTPPFFGVGSQDEMCIAFLYYYPKLPNPLTLCGVETTTKTTASKGSCKATHTALDLKPEEYFYRGFGGTSKNYTVGGNAFETGMESGATKGSPSLSTIAIAGLVSMIQFMVGIVRKLTN